MNIDIEFMDHSKGVFIKVVNLTVENSCFCIKTPDCTTYIPLSSVRVLDIY